MMVALKRESIDGETLQVAKMKEVYEKKM